MTPARKQRLILILLMLLGVGVAVGLVLFALNQNINLFYTPTEVFEGSAPKEQAIRVGGLVVENSVKRSPDSLKVSFGVTDNNKAVTIHYEGILPDLFREGQGIIALGKLNHDNVFIASQVLAKHDENYMPPEVADALARSHEGRL